MATIPKHSQETFAYTNNSWLVIRTFLCTSGQTAEDWSAMMKEHSDNDWMECTRDLWTGVQDCCHMSVVAAFAYFRHNLLTYKNLDGPQATELWLLTIVHKHGINSSLHTSLETEGTQINLVSGHTAQHFKVMKIFSA